MFFLFMKIMDGEDFFLQEMPLAIYLSCVCLKYPLLYPLDVGLYGLNLSFY